jgi:hypothetical protein
MKIKLNRDKIIEKVRRVRIETADFIFDLSINEINGKLNINKVDGQETSISLNPCVSNVIEIS